MSFPHRLGRAAAFSATLLALGVPVAAAATAPQRPDANAPERPFFDVREDAAAGEVAATPAQDALRRSLGVHGVVDVDPLTGTPRVVARLDGFLTGPSARDAVDIVLDYVRANPGVFKLDEDDLGGLRLVRDYTDVAGIRHLVWAQTAGGIAAFDNDLRASVTGDGRLINVLGSPLPDLEAAATSPALGATAALGAALRDVGRPAAEPRVIARGRGAAQATRFSGGHRADLVLVNGADGVRLAWHVTAHADADEVYDSLVDASSGEVLRRANRVERDGGWIFDYYPDAPLGGDARFVDFTAAGWLSGSSALAGTNAQVFMDLNDDDVLNTSGTWGSENAPPLANGFPEDFNPFTHANGQCAPTRTSTCSWSSFVPGSFPTPPSWYSNRLQNARQVFYFVNNFHDYLRDDPGIGFDAASGNFEGVDRVVAHSNDGANKNGDLSPFSSRNLGSNMPDLDHVNNANMLTPPDGQAPRMQMYLFTSFTGSFATDPTPDVNGGDDAGIVYHEYTHGLSNRLVTYTNGVGALDAHQSGSMGEAWSDWYAMDYLNAEGFAPDTGTAGEVTIDRYAGNGFPMIRTMGLDCPANVASAGCPGGGYTYGDLGTICWCGAEVHTDGEIWGQTLWDLRADPDVGSATARSLVTEGMRLSPANPSFLDMRNAILQADTALGTGVADDVWTAFAGRGMGYFAATTGAGDTAPIEDFELPPLPGEVGTLSGVVRDPFNGNAPVAGVTVAIPGNSAGLSDKTDALGRYSIANVPVGTYPLLRAAKHLYDSADTTGVEVVLGDDTAVNFQLRRDWSAFAGGGRVTSYTPPNYALFGCGPNGAIDQSLVTGWGSDDPGPRQVTVKLPRFVDVKEMAVDPGPACGDPADAGLAHFRLFVSKDGKTFTEVAEGTFDGADNGRLNLLNVPDRNAIRYVRLTMLSNQGNDFFLDMAELSVYGKPRSSCLGLAATRIGTEGANRMRGSGGADVFVGLGGNDRFVGRGGNDVMCGGTGADTLVGGAGVDRFDGGSGNDTIYARDGRRERTIRGGPGRDRVRKDAVDRTSSVERRF